MEKHQYLNPGLDALLKEGLQAGRLQFSIDPIHSFAKIDVLWVTYDTPVDEDDQADVDYVLAQIRTVLPYCLRKPRY